MKEELFFSDVGRQAEAARVAYMAERGAHVGSGGKESRVIEVAGNPGTVNGGTSVLALSKDSDRQGE